MLKKISANDPNPFQINMRHHDRPITDIQFNKDGDLLFTASKEKIFFACNMNGEVVANYDGHSGAINSITVSNDSNNLVSASADCSIIGWDVLTSKINFRKKTNSTAKHVSMFPRSSVVISTCDDSFKQVPRISFLDLRTGKNFACFKAASNPLSTIIDFTETKVVFGDSVGKLTFFDFRNMKGCNSNKFLENALSSEFVAEDSENFWETQKFHENKINRIRPSFCSTFFTTASSDGLAKIVDFEKMCAIKKFVSEEPLQDASIFPTNDKIACVGGINARDVTLTRGNKNFDVRFYDIVTQRYVGCYSPHFGTINAVAMHPSGNAFCSGGEDSVVVLFKFGREFFEVDKFTNLDH
jgi:translation initiation factor 3 subunit I